MEEKTLESLIDSILKKKETSENGTILEKAFNEITKGALSQLLIRNENLPPTEIVRITTMSGCSAVKK